MSQPKSRPNLQESLESPSEEVLILADVIGNSTTTLAQVMNDFLEIVKDPIIAGGFAMAHHGLVRATVDIDVLAMKDLTDDIEEFKLRGYKHESMQLPVGSLDLLTKGNKGVDFIHLKNAALRSSIQQRAVRGLFLKQPISFVSLEDLIILKLLALKGRKKKMDEVDLESLVSQPFDSAYVNSWKVKLNVKG